MKIGSVTVDGKDRVKVRATAASAALMPCTPLRARRTPHTPDSDSSSIR